MSIDVSIPTPAPAEFRHWVDLQTTDRPLSEDEIVKALGVDCWLIAAEIRARYELGNVEALS